MKPQQAISPVYALAFWALVIIKLCGFADISWFVVFLPVIALLGILAFVGILAIIGEIK